MRDIGYHKGDEWYTTPQIAEYVFNLIEPVIRGRKIYCFCDDENSEIVKVLLKNGYDVKYSTDDIFADNSTFKREIEKGERFFFTNPPFSKSTLIQKMMLGKVDFIVFNSNIMSTRQCDLAFNRYIYIYYLGTLAYHFGGKVGTTLISNKKLPITVNTEKYQKRDNEILTIDGIDYVYNNPKYFINTDKIYDNIAVAVTGVFYIEDLLKKYDYIKSIRPVIDGKALFSKLLMTKKKIS